MDDFWTWLKAQALAGDPETPYRRPGVAWGNPEEARQLLVVGFNPTTAIARTLVAPSEYAATLKSGPKLTALLTDARLAAREARSRSRARMDMLREILDRPLLETNLYPVPSTEMKTLTRPNRPRDFFPELRLRAHPRAIVFLGRWVVDELPGLGLKAPRPWEEDRPVKPEKVDGILCFAGPHPAKRGLSSLQWIRFGCAVARAIA